MKTENSVKQESSQANDGWQEIPLKCCTTDDVRDARYHIMKFQSKQDVEIVKSFTKPVRLHRKDPQNIQFQLTRKEIDAMREQGATQEAPLPVNAEGEEEMNLSQVAPDGGGRKNKKNMFKRKTKQVSMMDESKRKLRFEEFYPWVIEDYDGKNIYVGNYEAGSSDTQQVLFVFDRDGFKMIPAEKVYRFTPRNKYTTLTLEEAEAKMEKKSSVPRWLMKRMEDTSSEVSPDLRVGNISSQAANSSRRMRTVMGGSTSNDRDSDHDDIDFDEEFADDEEAPIMDGDEEENKLSERKVKKEQLKASHFDGQSDAEIDDDLDDLFETEKSRKVDKEGKKLRKVLNKTEGGVYESDDEDEDELNPYLSQSDIEKDDDEYGDDSQVKKGDDGSQLSPGRRAFFATNLGDSFVSIKAPVAFLAGFPKGDWNPQGFKRKAELTALPSKRMKSNDQKSVSPSPEVGVDLTSAGANNDLVTVQEVLKIVRQEPLTTKQLLLVLKNRVYAHPDNKLRIITIVKQNLKLADGKLVLKDNQ